MLDPRPSVEPGRKLPQELVRLVHHVELHRSGWWNRALERLVLVTLWLQSPATLDQVVAFLSESLAGRLQRAQVEAEIERLKSTGMVFVLPEGKLKVAEELDESLRHELAVVSSSEDQVRARFKSLAENEGLGDSSEDLWRDFEDLFLLPLVREAGARIYELLSSTTQLDEAIPSYGDLTRPLLKKYGADIRGLIVDFLDPHDPDVRAYVLRRLNAHFMRVACALDDRVLEKIAESEKKNAPQRVRVFLDTNFLFSILSLHDNPSNEVAQDLIQVIAQAESYVKVELYVIPITVEETRRVLREVIARLSEIPLARNVAAAAVGIQSSGLVNRYMQAAAEFEHGVLTANDFFGPYESGLVAILRERGVKLYNEDLSQLRVDQNVIDDIHDQEEIQKRFRSRGPKSYESNLHDMVLWHFAQRKRSSSPDGALELDSSVATVDFGLIAFDRYKRRKIGGSPVCLTPSALIQLLQFWVPQTEELERAIVGSFREPLLFLEFDRSTEETTVHILREISRFEGIDDLSPSTIYNILTDGALRARLETSPAVNSTQVAELVEAAVVQEARKLEVELEAIQHQRREEQQAAREQLEKTAAEAKKLDEILAARQSSIEQLETKIRLLEDDRQGLQGEVESLEQRVQTVEQGARQRTQEARDWRIFLSVAVVSAVLLSLGVFFGGRIWTRNTLTPPWIKWLAASVGAAFAWSLVCGVAIRGRPTLTNHIASRGLAKSRAALASGIAAVLLGILATAIWEAMK
jgi:hypothetical protein